MMPEIADAIIALINSKPQSPTKAEIEDVLEAYLGRDGDTAGVDPVMVNLMPLPYADTRGGPMLTMTRAECEAIWGGPQREIELSPEEWRLVMLKAAGHFAQKAEPENLADDVSNICL